MIPRRFLAVSAVVPLSLLGGFFFFETREASSARLVAAGPTPVRSHEVLSQVYEVDRKYRSMLGPWSEQEVRLLETPEPELLWIVGYEAVMVDGEGKSPMPQEFMCHSNLDLDPREHLKHFGGSQGLSGRLFTLSQGQLEVTLPDGFGIPVLSDEPLSLTTQVLNLNHDNPDLEVRHRVTLRFVRDRDLARPMKALVPLSAYGLAALGEEPAHFGFENDPAAGPEENHGSGCLVGQNASNHEYKDALGQPFTGHWVVKPGREVNRTRVTRILDLAYDTSLHYVAVHLHPFAESLELKDLTTGETIFKSYVEPAPEGVGIARVDHFSSTEGVPLFRDHEYELISVYDNTSGEDQDSMAVMYMYLLDPEFKNPVG